MIHQGDLKRATLAVLLGDGADGDLLPDSLHIVQCADFSTCCGEGALKIALAVVPAVRTLERSMFSL